MRLLYADEHLKCPNYDNTECSIVQEKHLKPKESVHVRSLASRVVFLLDGEINYSVGLKAHTASGGHILFLPASHDLHCLAVTKVHYLVIRIYEHIQLCDCFRLEELKQLAIENEEVDEELQDSFFLLKMNTMMEKYVDMLLLCYREGLRCRYYNRGKTRELMFLFRAFYPKEDLLRFFYPAVSTDTYFSQFVMDNYHKYDNLPLIAEAMNYTVSGFEKRFRKVFGRSPYSWRLQRKAQDAFHLISTTDMSLKQISDKFGFSTPASFNNFIKKHFGKTPGQIRKNTTDGGNEQ